MGGGGGQGRARGCVGREGRGQREVWAEVWAERSRKEMTNGTEKTSGRG